METKIAALGGRPARRNESENNHSIANEVLSDFEEIISSNELSPWRGGHFTHTFEERWAQLNKRKHSVMVNSGTSALHCAVVAAGIEPGDQVVISASGYVSAASAVIQAGAIPVICDIRSDTMSIDTRDVLKRMTSRTRAIIIIHMWGIPNPMDEIVPFAKAHNLQIIEDCAQAHMAYFGPKPVGSFGALATYSFAPGKMVSTGQGGMVTCDDSEHADRVRSLTTKGKGTDWHDYRELGYSYSVTEFQAALGLRQLPMLKEKINSRNQLIKLFKERLNITELTFIEILDNSTTSYYKLPFILTNRDIKYRDSFIKLLSAENINTRITHPPMHTIKYVYESMQNNKDAAIINKPRPVADDVLPRLLELDAHIADGQDAIDITNGIAKVTTYMSQP